MKDIFPYFFGGMAFVMVIYLFVWILTPAPDPAKAAYESYLSGESASTIAERKDKFNLALESYKKLEAEYNPQSGNGVLYYDLGNSYFQLEEYPWAVYYYYKALALSPGNHQTVNNLDASLAKLNLPAVQADSIFERLFLLRAFSLPTRFQFFFFSAILFFGSLLAFLWLDNKWILNVVVVSGCLAGFLLISTLYETYAAPVQGVLVQAASLYRDAGAQYAKVTEDSLSPGLKVEVLDQRQGGKWLKILTPTGQLGYVSSDSLRLL